MINKIEKLAHELLITTFEYRGKEYNLKLRGWSFSFNDRKNSLGICRLRKRHIQLSRWMIENSNEDISVWRNTMLHEIAHGIDFVIRGTSNHDYKWRNIALAIGCDGKRTNSIKIETKSSKYTLSCKNCGYEFPSHKKRKREASCGICDPGYFNKDFLLEQVQNY